MGDDNPVFKDMFGMMLTIMSRSVENDDSVMEKLNSLSQRLDRLEAKVGRAEDIAVPRSLAVRNLPLPQDGETDCQVVKTVFSEIDAEGIDLDKDIVQVVRKGVDGTRLGTVFVEMATEEARGRIMKKKRNLAFHSNPIYRKLIVKNMKQHSELKMDIALNELLRRMPGGENYFIASSGHIRHKPSHTGSVLSDF